MENYLTQSLVFGTNSRRTADQYPHPSNTALALRAGVLKTDRFWHSSDRIDTPSFDGYLYEEITAADGVIWRVPRENGFATGESGEEKLTTLGANLCFTGVIDTHIGKKSYRTILHTNPFETFPQRSIYAQSPFVTFARHLPAEARLMGIQLVYRGSTDKSAVAATEAYCVAQFTGVPVTHTVIPFDERYDIQSVAGEVAAFKARKPVGVKIK